MTDHEKIKKELIIDYVTLLSRPSFSWDILEILPDIDMDCFLTGNTYLLRYRVEYEFFTFRVRNLFVKKYYPNFKVDVYGLSFKNKEIEYSKLNKYLLAPLFEKVIKLIISIIERTYQLKNAKEKDVVVNMYNTKAKDNTTPLIFIISGLLSGLFNQEDIDHYLRSYAKDHSTYRDIYSLNTTNWALTKSLIQYFSSL